jgi:alpha-tubulin suppressor-like RCC1 family protein
MGLTITGSVILLYRDKNQIKLNINEPVKQISWGNYCINVLTKSGKYYIYSESDINNFCEENSEKKFCDNIYYESKITGKLNCDVNISYNKLYTGSKHCFLEDKQGKIYAMGDNTYGQLGIKESSRLDKLQLVNI